MKAILKTLTSGCTYIQTFECARLVYSHVAKPRTHVFNVELRNVGKNFPLLSTDFIFGQILKTILQNGGLNLFKRGKILVRTGCKENHFYSLPFGQAEASIY